MSQKEKIIDEKVNFILYLEKEIEEHKNNIKEKEQIFKEKMESLEKEKDEKVDCLNDEIKA